MEKATQKLWNLTKALNDDQQHATIKKSSPFKGRYPDLHGQEGSLFACRQFPKDSLFDISKGKTRRHQNEDQGTTTSEFSIQEMNCAIRQLKNKKAPGKDGISNEIIRHLGSVAKKKMLDKNNQSWNTGTFPTSWKEAITIPTLKNGKDWYSKTSYRPTSLLSCLGKTMEHMMNRRLQHHLEKNGLLFVAVSLQEKQKDRQRTSPYLPDWRSGTAGNPAEEEEEEGVHLLASFPLQRITKQIYEVDRTLVVSYTTGSEIQAHRSASDRPDTFEQNSDLGNCSSSCKMQLKLTFILIIRTTDITAGTAHIRTECMRPGCSRSVHVDLPFASFKHWTLLSDGSVSVSALYQLIKHEKVT